MTSDEQHQYDVVVIVGGAAGLGGALVLARSRRSVVVVDGGQPRNAPADGVHGYLTRDGMPPSELVRTGRLEVEGDGGRVLDGRVAQVDRTSDGRLAVTLTDGRVLTGRRLLVATGLVDELPDVPGVQERWGRDVLHCPYSVEHPSGVGEHLTADPQGRTGVPGVWAAGNLTDLSAQVGAAAAAGAAAGAGIDGDLALEDTRVAVDALRAAPSFVLPAAGARTAGAR